MPLWNLGQRDAEQNWPISLKPAPNHKRQGIKLRVAGLVRGALWDMALAKIRYEQAQVDLDIYEQLYGNHQALR